MSDQFSGGGASKVQRSSKEDRRRHMQKTGAIKSPEKIFRVPDWTSVDLFGAVSTGQPTMRQACDRCGAMFEQVVRTGRPLRFCSDTCRRDQKADQMRRWAGKAPASSSRTVTCRHCGQSFEPKPRLKGRAPHWCSARCRRDALAGKTYRPPGADLFTFETEERKSP